MTFMLPAVEMQNLGLVALAGGFGAVIGIEREFAGKPAGLRTHMFVCASSAMLMLLGGIVVDQFQEQESHQALSADPIRILQAIVVGISFLGAGTIVHHSNDNVEGLTTAASVLLTAGVGIAVAVGQFYFAGGVALLTVGTLIAVGWMERTLMDDKP